MQFEDHASYVAVSATLRIHGQDLPFAGITTGLGVQPTHTHRVSDVRNSRLSPWVDDAWHFTAAVDEDRPLSDHLRELWKIVEPNTAFLQNLDARVDIFCGYRSNVDHAGVTIEPDALKIFEALNCPFHLSIIVLE